MIDSCKGNVPKYFGFRMLNTNTVAGGEGGGSDANFDIFDFGGDSGNEGSNNNSQQADPNAGGQPNANPQGDGGQPQGGEKKEPPIQNQLGELKRLQERTIAENKQLQQRLNMMLTGQANPADIKKQIEYEKKFGKYDDEHIGAIKDLVSEETGDLRNTLEQQRMDLQMEKYFTLNNVAPEVRQAINSALTDAPQAPAIRQAMAANAVTFQDLHMIATYPNVIKAYKDMKTKYENLQNQMKAFTPGAGRTAELPEGAPDFMSMDKESFNKWKKANLRP